MKVYIGGSIAGGRDFEKYLKLICDVVEGMGHKVTSRDFVINLHPDDQVALHARDDRSIFKRDTRNVSASEAVIFEVSQPSHGVGYEHAVAEQQGKPVLMLRHESLRGQRYSPFLAGTGYPKLWFSFYNEENLRDTIGLFFAEFFAESRVVRERG